MKSLTRHRFISSAILFILSFSVSVISARANDAPVKPYPLKTCIVTDNDLGSMGEETSIKHEGREIKFCCAPCEKKFLKNPARYLPKLDPAATPAAPVSPAAGPSPSPAPAH